MTFKTAFTIIESDAKWSELRPVKWTDVEFKKREPSFEEIERVVQPLFPDANFERVAVNGFEAASDMFVDEIGGPEFKNLPINEAATVIYWTASQMHKINRSLTTRPTYAELHRLASDQAAGMFSCETELPCIHGRAILFRDRIWF